MFVTKLCQRENQFDFLDVVLSLRLNRKGIPTVAFWGLPLQPHSVSSWERQNRSKSIEIVLCEILSLSFFVIFCRFRLLNNSILLSIFLSRVSQIQVVSFAAEKQRRGNHNAQQC